jgi:chemotaxis protein methyltransferase CheR
MNGSYEDFKNKLYSLTKIDLNSYKEKQMKRRIESLITRKHKNSYDEFYDALTVDNALLDEFVTYLTINVSEFYRNPDQWETMQKEVIPYLMKTFGRNVTVWSAACSTGDEPYTLVMILNKVLPLSNIHIIATDLDHVVLEKARRGVYSSNSLRGLPAEFKDKYFIHNSDNTYTISDDVKKCVEFRQADLLRDPYPKNLNLIVCRNVLIYFTEEAKKNIYRKFSDSLRKNGILFIGNTEQIIYPAEYGFESHKAFFYHKV